MKQKKNTKNNTTQINEALRGHVTRTGFDLSLGKSHIAALIIIDLQENFPTAESISEASSGRSILSSFVSASHGLQERGLVWWNYIPHSNQDPRAIRGLTTAGKLVLGLLKESGLYDEYFKELASLNFTLLNKDTNRIREFNLEN